MRLMILIKATKDSEAGVMPSDNGEGEVEIRPLFEAEDFRRALKITALDVDFPHLSATNG
ncbi:MAG TPA: hypothetical protein VIE89_04985 [Candidatus Binatia bacterium]